MTKQELQDILLLGGTLSAETMEAIVSAMETDAEGLTELAELFPAASVLLRTSSAGNVLLRRMHLCAHRYLSRFPRNSPRYHDVVSGIYADEVTYFSLQNAPETCMLYVDMFLEMENTPDKLTSTVLGQAVDTLIKLGMYTEAVTYVERLELYVETHTLPVVHRYLMHANLMYGYAFCGSKTKFLTFRRKLREYDAGKIPRWLVYYCDLYALGSMAVLKLDGGDDLPDFDQECDRLLAEFDSGYGYYLIDQAFLILPILEKRMARSGPEEVIRIMEGLMRFSTSYAEKADYYGWFFETMQADPARFPAQYEAYCRILRAYRTQIRENQRLSIGDELIRHSAEIKYLQQATVDALTQLPNRFVYESTLTALREGELPWDLAVVMADLNELKYTNDHIGHEAGDELIRIAAALISESFDGLGQVYRVGGDEFIALLHCGENTLNAAVAALREKAKGWTGQLAPALSLSVGFTRASAHPGRPIEVLIRLAETAMYADKDAHYEVSDHVRRRS